MYQVYDAKQPNDSTLILTIVSPDGDNNFPGTVTAHTTYKVLSNNTLDITFTTDYRKMIRSSWNLWDIVGTLLVVGLCSAFYWYFW